MTSTSVHVSNVVKNSLNPKWKTFEISLWELCNGNPDRLIKIEIFDWDDGTNENDLIGGFQTTYSKFKEAFLQKTEFLVINPKKARRKQATYNNSGTVFLTHFKIK